MKRRPALLAAACGALALTLAGCGRPATPGGPARLPAGASLLAFASIPPLAYFTRAVGGSRVQVRTLVQPGQDPHTYEPTPRQVAELARARLLFLAGFPFEKALVPRLESTMPQLEIVDTRDGIPLLPEAAMDPEGAPAGEMDPHVWMSPRLARRQAQNIRDALIRADPVGESVYRAGFGLLAAELQQADQELARALAPLRGRELLVYHPAFGYFAAEYGLKQVAVQTGGKEPTARQLSSLIRKAREGGVRVVFVQPQFSQAGARAVAEAIGGAVVPLDDLPSDYLANLRDLSSKVREALSGTGAAP
jgi:zinc transport system substrate-binding protein